MLEAVVGEAHVWTPDSGTRTLLPQAIIPCWSGTRCVHSGVRVLVCGVCQEQIHGEKILRFPVNDQKSLVGGERVQGFLVCGVVISVVTMRSHLIIWYFGFSAVGGCSCFVISRSQPLALINP